MEEQNSEFENHISIKCHSCIHYQLSKWISFQGNIIIYILLENNLAIEKTYR